MISKNQFFRFILIGITIISCIICIFYYLQYRATLSNQEKDYLKSIYRKRFTGRIVYLKEYEKDFYVLSIRKHPNDEFTIGKVKIKNFKNVVVGDSIVKHQNSFDVYVINKDGASNFRLDWE